ncbi:MAG: tetratricopeptide repeat protein [Sedimentisphaerales bacterium]|nr:tetratricopeptide repeat protein [Sedimentisphaerales bacterium]
MSYKCCHTILLRKTFDLMDAIEYKFNDRQIRVFISSTFRDMKEERDYLVKFIFPQLRKLCESRSVTWGEVDLRWGVTEEQAAEGQVLPICLEEINRCRPYFIGLLGERYGWVPQNISPELLEKEPWLKEQFEGRKSVTELEILHGVLRNPKMAGHAYFYFRDPNFIDTLPEDRRSEYLCEDVDSADKLKTLKRQIRDKQFPVRENYPTPEALGELILKDLTAVIDRLYPEGSQPDPLDREAMDHEAYTQSRAQVYIGRESYYQQLDEHAGGQSVQPLVILGESGGGKSALLANWIIRYRKAYPDAFIIQHYIGASPYSADWMAMLRRIMGEFKRHLHIEEEIPSKPEELRDAFKVWLYRAAAQKKIILVLDAINQLTDTDNAPDLPWLPLETPANMRIIVSTLPGRSLEEIHRRNWPVFSIAPLDAQERRKLIAEYLRLQSKSLEARRVERITNAPQSANPLYLRVLLDELRVFGVYEQLDQRIDYYLQAQNPYELYIKVIARWEEDYGQGSRLVQDALSLLFAARRGLSEAELLDALGQDGQPLPQAKWSPLYLAMSDALVSRGGLLTFAHNFLRIAAMNNYMQSHKHNAYSYFERDEINPQQADELPSVLWKEFCKCDARLHLANYFAKQPISLRQADELPWLLQQAEERNRLQDCLLDIDRFRFMQESNPNELLGYWIWLGQEQTIGKFYLESFDSWRNLQSEDTAIGYAANELGCFLCNAAQYAEAETLTKRAIAITEANFGKNHPYVADALSNLATIYYKTNRLAEAETQIKQAMTIHEVGLGQDHLPVAMDLNILAKLYQDTNRLSEAEPLMKRAMAIAESSLGKGHPFVAAILSNLAMLYQTTNRLVDAEPLHQQVLLIYETTLGQDHPKVVFTLNNLAMLYMKMNRFAEAEPLMKRSLVIYEARFGDAHPYMVILLNNLALLYINMNRLTEAEPLMKWALMVSKKNYGADDFNTVTISNNYSDLLTRIGDSQDEIMGKLKMILHPFCVNLDSEVADNSSKGGNDDNQQFSSERIRQTALEFYKQGEYARAEELLNHLLQTGFEPVSIHHHLARICLITNRLEEAEKHVELAWAARKAARLYIIPRLLWFQFVFMMLESEEKENDRVGKTESLMERIKSVMQNEGAFMEWTMEPVLEYLKPKLSQVNYEMLAGLIFVLGCKKTLSDYDPMTEDY